MRLAYVSGWRYALAFGFSMAGAGRKDIRLPSCVKLYHYPISR